MSEYADAMDLFMASASAYPLLSPEHERALLERCAQGDEDARALLINSNLRLLVAIAKRYHR